MGNSYRRNKLHPKKRGGMNQHMGQNTRVVNAAMDGDMPMPNENMPLANPNMPEANQNMPANQNMNQNMNQNSKNCPPCPCLDENGNVKKEEGGIMAKITGFNDKLATGPPAFLAGVQANLSTKLAEQGNKFTKITDILKGEETKPVVIEGGRRRRRRQTKKNKKSKKSKKGKKGGKGKKSKKRTIRR